MRHVHLIGIGGSGLSAIARVLLERGYTVSGSDRAPSPMADELAAAGARVFKGHSAENVIGADFVVRSSAIPNDNPEVTSALLRGIPVLKRADFLEVLMQNQTCYAIAGTHGKTTTTSMTAWILKKLGADPSFIIGGISKNLASNAHAGNGNIFVIEADEYDNMFLGLHPDLAVVTYLEHDHPDCFPSLASYRTAFEAFVSRINPGGALITWADQPETVNLAGSVPRGCRTFSYGETRHAVYQLQDCQVNDRGGMTFTAVFSPTGEKLSEVSLQVPGKHNALNALAALAMVHQGGFPAGTAAEALAEFEGTGRRIEILGEAGEAVVISDYAHHPTEIRTTLSAVRSRFPGCKIWAVWQPHTYSRTRILLSQFAEAFKEADAVIVTEIFAARELDPGFSAEQVVSVMKHADTRYLAANSQVVEYLTEHLQPGDVLVILSAGDAEEIGSRVLENLKKGGSTNG